MPIARACPPTQFQPFESVDWRAEVRCAGGDSGKCFSRMPSSGFLWRAARSAFLPLLSRPKMPQLRRSIVNTDFALAMRRAVSSTCRLALDESRLSPIVGKGPARTGSNARDRRLVGKLQLPHHRLKARLWAQRVHERVGLQTLQARVTQPQRRLE